VFQLAPAADGSWTEKILHNSAVVVGDGHTPYGSLIFDAVGNLYGTTYWGGAYANGAVFELTPTVSGAWTETVLHSFNNNGTDGYGPYGSLTFDAAAISMARRRQAAFMALGRRYSRSNPRFSAPGDARNELAVWGR
jgi:uncharacterized repeat protein (TIGR03803 family)